MFNLKSVEIVLCVYIRKHMEFLRLEQFLKLFKSNKINYSDFLKKASVKVGAKSRPLKEYMIDKEIKISDIKTLFENIKNRDEYLIRFFNLKEVPNLKI